MMFIRCTLVYLFVSFSFLRHKQLVSGSSCTVTMKTLNFDGETHEGCRKRMSMIVFVHENIEYMPPLSQNQLV